MRRVNCVSPHPHDDAASLAFCPGPPSRPYDGAPQPEHAPELRAAVVVPSSIAGARVSSIWIVASPKGAPLMTTAHLVGAAQQVFGSALRVEQSRAEWETDCYLYVTLPREPDFAIAPFRDNLMIGLEGTAQQNARSAAWIRSLLPEGAPRLIAGERSWAGHAELPFGVTPEQVLAGWVDHSVPGWDARDPDLS